MIRSTKLKAWLSIFVAPLLLAFGIGEAIATPYLVADIDTGQTLIENDSTAPWYPASVTKLMTVYVALSAVRDGTVTLDTPLTMSVRAARVPPSKMGFRPGTEVTLGNALKMLMVKSPNDIAVMVAEGLGGSVEGFADQMNAAAVHLGLQESHFVNPNGLHDPAHVSSARDMAMIARALLKEFPDQSDLFSIGAIQLGNQIITNHNGLLGHYPGADGMKTGFTCAAGFNVVASANHNGRRLIVVVLGSPSARERTMKAAQLFDLGFAKWGGGPTLESLPKSAQTEAPDMHGDICSRHNRAAIAAAEEELAATAAAVSVGQMGRGAAFAVASAPFLPGFSTAPVHFDPVPVFVGPIPGWNGPVLAAHSSGTDAQKANANADEKPAAAAAEPAAPTHRAERARLHQSRRVREAAHPRPAREAVPAKPLHPKRYTSVLAKHDSAKSVAQ
jgi:D-alanyl-D-alanine carboxypeptidase